MSLCLWSLLAPAKRSRPLIIAANGRLCEDRRLSLCSQLSTVMPEEAVAHSRRRQQCWAIVHHLRDQKQVLVSCRNESSSPALSVSGMRQEDSHSATAAPACRGGPGRWSCSLGSQRCVQPLLLLLPAQLPGSGCTLYAQLNMAVLPLTGSSRACLRQVRWCCHLPGPADTEVVHASQAAAMSR